MVNETAEKPQQTGGAAPAAATSAPAATPAQPAETPQPSPEPKLEQAPQGAQPAKVPQTPQEKVEFFKARKEAKAKESSLAEENTTLKKRLEALEKAPAQAKPETPSPVSTSIFDDPDTWAKGVEERAEKRALAMIQEREQAQLHDAERAAATQWLLSQSNVRGDKEFAGAVSVLLQTPKSQGGLLEAATADPVAAAELAYQRVCNSAGIGSGGSNPGAAASAGVRSSAQPMGGKRVFATGEGKKYIDEIDPRKDRAEYMRRIEEVEAAIREGRIR